MRLFAYATALLCMACSVVSALKPMAEFDVEPEIVTRDPDSGLEEMLPNFAELYDYAVQFLNIIKLENEDSDLAKRDTLEDVLTGVLTSVKDSQVVEKILYEIAGSKTQIDNLSKYVYVLAARASSSNSSLSISLNMTEILNTVLESGVIQGTADSLLLNDANRENLTTNVGDLLVQRPYIPQIVNNLGAGDDLTWDMIFNTVRNFQSKAPELQDNETTYSKRADDYLGSLNSFINNLIGAAASGGSIDDILSSVLGAVNASGIVTPIVLTVVQRPIINMVGRILSNLYDYGVLDSIPISDLFNNAKKTHVLANGLQQLLTSERYSPGVAKLFQQLEDLGDLEKVRASLWGPV